MVDENEVKTTTEVLEPVHTAVIGNGSAKNLESGSVGVTSQDQPNVITTVVRPAVALLTRFIKTFLVTVLGLLSSSLTTNVIPSKDFADLLWKCAGLSIAAAVVDLIKNLITVLGRLEGKYPLATGSI